MEIGYSLAKNVPVFSTDTLIESPHRFLVHRKEVHEALENVKPDLEVPRLPDQPDLYCLQQFYSKVARLRGFHEETRVEIMLLLVEEIGELAKAIRAMEDLTVSATDPAPKDVQLELADCLNYLIHMANSVGVNLEVAFREKERINASRNWTRPSQL